MAKKIFLQYPCGKKFELRMPINILDGNGKVIIILPSSKDYFEHAKNKFQINNLKVVEENMPDEKIIVSSTGFISLYRKIRSVE